MANNKNRREPSKNKVSSRRAARRRDGMLLGSRMTTTRIVGVIGLCLALITPNANAVVRIWANRQVGVIMPPDSRDCVFFKLEGVSTADPDISTEAWIAIPRTHIGFKERYALLLWAKGSQTPITVETSGVAEPSCGGVVGVWQIYTTN